MTDKIKQKWSLGSVAEDLFVELFCDTFGPEKSEYLFLQYPSPIFMETGAPLIFGK